MTVVFCVTGCSVNGANNEGQNPLLAGIVSRSDIKVSVLGG